MKTLVTVLLPFVGRHWLRIGIVGVLLILLNQKQIDLSIQLGSPKAPSPRESVPSQSVSEPERDHVLTDNGAGEDKSWMDQLNIFGGSDARLIDRLRRLSDSEVPAFIRRFKDVAKTEKEKYGIPASIILANGLLHAQAGQREASRSVHNYFGLPCSDDWVGPTHSSEGQCFRAYQNAWTSFRDHSLFLTTGRYAALPRLGNTDYRRWAVAMEELDYGNTEDLAEQLVAVIDRYQLFQFD